MSAVQANCLCWCGFEHRNNHGNHAYRCVPFNDMKVWPELLALFLACGCDPSKGEVGIVLTDDFVRLQRAHQT